MQLVLSNNRIVAHGENFLAMGGVVINTETGARHENATIAECDGCPSDIDKVGYEYHAGVFVPCAPFGTGNNNGFFMEVCESCATPRNSGIPIKGGLGRENLNIFPLLWENASPSSAFAAQTIALPMADLVGVILVVQNAQNAGTQGSLVCAARGSNASFYYNDGNDYDYRRIASTSNDGIYIYDTDRGSGSNWSYGYKQEYLVPLKIYGVKI